MGRNQIQVQIKVDNIRPTYTNRVWYLTKDLGFHKALLQGVLAFTRRSLFNAYSKYCCSHVFLIFFFNICVCYSCIFGLAFAQKSVWTFLQCRIILHSSKDILNILVTISLQRDQSSYLLVVNLNRLGLAKVFIL